MFPANVLRYIYDINPMMTSKSVKAFWDRVGNDKFLQEKLLFLIDGEIDTFVEINLVVKIAQEAGFNISIRDLLQDCSQSIPAGFTILLSDEIMANLRI